MRKQNGPRRAHAIEVTGLGKTYPGGIEAVKGIDFDVTAGEVFGLLGPNGAGKSTTIGMLTTTVRPTAGRARLAGVFDVVADPIGARSVSAVVFQESVVDRSLTGRRNLEIHARLWGLSAADSGVRIDELSEAFVLEHLVDRPMSTYSGGERRRLEIARALLARPKVLFLDEPSVGLDPKIRQELLDSIAQLRTANGTTILLTTHYLDEADRLCDRVGIMHDGRIAAIDTPAALRGRLGRELIEVRVAGDARTALDALRARDLVGPDAFVVGTTITLTLGDRTPGETVDAITALGLATTAVTSRPPTLDDVYVRLTGERIAA